MEQAALKSSEELYDTDISVGEILRRTRVHYGQSVRDVEQAIRVRASQIEAIETDHTENLPGRVYAIGFVRSYSEYLGLDGGKMVELFKRQQGTKPRTPELEFPAPASESKLPSAWLIAACLVVVVMMPVLYMAVTGETDSKPAVIPEVPEHLQTDTLSILTLDKDIQAAQSEAKQSEIFINVKENSWVEIKNAESEVLISRVLESGEQYYVPNSPDLVITLGNAGAVEFDTGGGKFISFGKTGESVKDIPLDLNHLKEYLASEKTVTE